MGGAEQQKIIKASIWLVGVSWINRLLGLCSVFILARLLSPEAFGIVAVIMLVIQFAEVISDAGSEQYYIQLKSPSSADLNTAWTINLLLKFTISLLLFISTPFIVALFNRPELLLGLQLMVFIPVISACSNGYIYQLKKEINFELFAKITGVVKLIGSLSAIVLALLLQSYWAILIGMFVSSILYTLFSYLYLPKRAALGLSGWRNQLVFSKWIILKSLIGHGRAKFDVWFAGSTLGLAPVGGYNLAKDLVLLPNREFLTPVTHVLFSSIANADNYSVVQKERIQKALFSTLLLVFPMSVCWFFIAYDFVLLILGEKWLPYVDVIQWLAPLGITFAVGNFNSFVMTALNKVKALFFFDLFTLTFSAVLLAMSYQFINDVVNLAIFRTITGLFTFIAGVMLLTRIAQIPYKTVLACFYIPILCSVGIAVTLYFVLYFQLPTWLHLLTTLIVAGVTFMLILWLSLRFKLLNNLYALFLNSIFTKIVSMISK